MSVTPTPEELEKNSMFFVEQMLGMEKIGDNLWKDRLGYASLDRDTVHTMPKTGIRTYKINWHNNEEGKAMEDAIKKNPDAVVAPVVTTPAVEGDAAAKPETPAVETTPAEAV